MLGRITSVAMAAMLLCATSAHAIDKCKVKVSKKTGVIEVSATGVGGTLLWGAESGSETTPFNNAGTCLDGDKAKKCNLADPATVDAKTPPSDCTLYFDDGVLACSAWVPGCVPGLRDSTVCIPDPSASPRYIDNGDGTVSDQTTCLMWEQKTGSATGYNLANICPAFGPNCGDPHHADNLYTWAASSPSVPDGTAFTSFLAALNGPSPFAGHDDWRLPTITEMEGIVDLGATGCGGGSPCIDPVFGPTQTTGYWSSSTVQDSPSAAWGVNFGSGLTYVSGQGADVFVRAVRGGS